MNLFLTNILGSVTTTIIVTILSTVFFIKPYKKHKELYLKIMRISRHFEDTNKCSDFGLNILGKQFQELKIILEDIDNTIDLNPIFSFLFNYNSIRRYVLLVFEYNRNPIMLPEYKEFEDDYRMDLNAVFKKIKNLMNFQKRVLFIFIMFLISCIAFININKLI